MKVWERWYLNNALKRKLVEFKNAGYGSVSQNELLAYCESYLWPRKKAVSLKEKRQWLNLITPYQFFDYQQLRIQTTPDSLVDMKDLSDLF